MGKSKMIEVDWTATVPVVTLDLGPFGVNESTLAAIGVDLMELMQTLEPAKAIVDLTPTHHLNSRAISLLIQAWRDFKKRNGRIAFCGMNSYTLEALKTMQLNRHWEIYTTVDDAQRAMQPIERKGAKKPAETAEPRAEA